MSISLLLLLLLMCYVVVFFFKQKTAYEMRISDWSSDVCSSDLHGSGGLAIQVADTGMGMKPEDIPQAMVPFGRLKAAEKIEGTGLGLPLAKELVELHD